MPVESPLPKNHPALRSWERYKFTDEYRNSYQWADTESARDGSMWAAFYEGWQACQIMHDDERQTAMMAEPDPMAFTPSNDPWYVRLWDWLMDKIGR